MHRFHHVFHCWIIFLNVISATAWSAACDSFWISSIVSKWRTFNFIFHMRKQSKVARFKSGPIWHLELPQFPFRFTRNLDIPKIVSGTEFLQIIRMTATFHGFGKRLRCLTFLSYNKKPGKWKHNKTKKINSRGKRGYFLIFFCYLKLGSRHFFGAFPECNNGPLGTRRGTLH